MDEGPAYPEGGTDIWAREWYFHLREGKVWLGLRQSSGSAEEAADSRRGGFSRGQVGRGAGPGGATARGDQSRKRAGCDWGDRIVKVHERRWIPDAEVRAGRPRHQQYRQLLALLPVAGDEGAVAHGWLWRRLRFDCRYREGRAGHHHRQQHRRVPPGAGNACKARPQAARTEADRERSPRE